MKNYNSHNTFDSDRSEVRNYLVYQKNKKSFYNETVIHSEFEYVLYEKK